MFRLYTPDSDEYYIYWLYKPHKRRKYNKMYFSKFRSSNRVISTMDISKSGQSHSTTCKEYTDMR